MDEFINLINLKLEPILIVGKIINLSVVSKEKEKKKIVVRRCICVPSTSCFKLVKIDIKTVSF